MLTPALLLSINDPPVIFVVVLTSRVPALEFKEPLAIFKVFTSRAFAKSILPFAPLLTVSSSSKFVVPGVVSSNEKVDVKFPEPFITTLEVPPPLIRPLPALAWLPLRVMVCPLRISGQLMLFEYI